MISRLYIQLLSNTKLQWLLVDDSGRHSLQQGYFMTYNPIYLHKVL